MSQPQPRILIVDDDRLMITLLAGILRQEGYRLVDRALSGQEALAKCRLAPPDIIFMDIEMPEMNGIETVEALAEEGIGAQIVLVSASPTTAYVHLAMKYNVARFVVKPMSPKTVGDAIAACLKRAPPAAKT
ncbi:MAG: response regulator [Pseudomonadota bacterium]